MYDGLLNNLHNIMNDSDIKYILELIDDAIENKNWDTIEDVKESLAEFLDD